MNLEENEGSGKLEQYAHCKDHKSVLIVGVKAMLTIYLLTCILCRNRARSIVGSASDSRARGLGLDTRVRPHTFVSPSADSRRAVVSYWRKYVYEVLINRLGGLRLPRKSVVRLTDRPDMTLTVYHGQKTTQQQHIVLDCSLEFSSYMKIDVLQVEYCVKT